MANVSKAEMLEQMRAFKKLQNAHRMQAKLQEKSSNKELNALLGEIATNLYDISVLVGRLAGMAGVQPVINRQDEEPDIDEDVINQILCQLDPDLEPEVMILSPDSTYDILPLSQAQEEYPFFFDGEERWYELPTAEDMYFVCSKKNGSHFKEGLLSLKDVAVIKLNEDLGEPESPTVEEKLKAIAFFDQYTARRKVKDGSYHYRFLVDWN